MNMRLIVIIGLMLSLTSVTEAVTLREYPDLFGAQRLAYHPDGCPPKAVCLVEPYQTTEVAWCEVKYSTDQFRCGFWPFEKR